MNTPHQDCSGKEKDDETSKEIQQIANSLQQAKQWGGGEHNQIHNRWFSNWIVARLAVTVNSLGYQYC